LWITSALILQELGARLDGEFKHPIEDCLDALPAACVSHR
jgi:hypothetical protein